MTYKASKEVAREYLAIECHETGKRYGWLRRMLLTELIAFQIRAREKELES